LLYHPLRFSGLRMSLPPHLPELLLFFFFFSKEVAPPFFPRVFKIRFPLSLSFFIFFFSFRAFLRTRALKKRDFFSSAFSLKQFSLFIYHPNNTNVRCFQPKLFHLTWCLFYYSRDFFSFFSFLFFYRIFFCPRVFAPIFFPVYSRDSVPPRHPLRDFVFERLNSLLVEKP